MTRPRIIVCCGSRNADLRENRAHVRRVLEHYLPEDLRQNEPTIIHGACGWSPRSWSPNSMRGIDRLVHEEATDLGFWVRPMPADWVKHGKAAGPIRNRQMLDCNPDLVIAFWDGRSRGTLDTMNEALRRGIEVTNQGLAAGIGVTA